MNDIILKYSQLGDVFDHFSLGVIVLSPDRKIISINNAAEQILRAMGATYHLNCEFRAYGSTRSVKREVRDE